MPKKKKKIKIKKPFPISILKRFVFFFCGTVNWRMCSRSKKGKKNMWKKNTNLQRKQRALQVKVITLRECWKNERKRRRKKKRNIKTVAHAYFKHSHTDQFKLSIYVCRIRLCNLWNRGSNYMYAIASFIIYCF